MVRSDSPDGSGKRYIGYFLEVKMDERPVPDCDFCPGFVVSGSYRFVGVMIGSWGAARTGAAV